MHIVAIRLAPLGNMGPLGSQTFQQFPNCGEGWRGKSVRRPAKNNKFHFENHPHTLAATAPAPGRHAVVQVVHDVAIQSLPVRFAIDRAGLVGADGPTHAGSFDITYLSTLPNFVVMAASDESELIKMINTSVKINDRPSAFRYPRGNGIGIELPGINEILEIGKGRIIKKGKEVALLNFGARLEECKKASEILLSKGLNITIIDARFAKPLDEKLIMEVATSHDVVISIEEGSVGGFGSHVMQLLSDKGVFDRGLKFRSMTLPDVFIDQDTPENMYIKAGLDSQSIVNKIEETLRSDIIFAKTKNKNLN